MGLKDRVTGAFASARRRTPWLDHLVQAAGRYGADQGNQLAAAVTYFSFLSLFPLLLLTASVLGIVLHGNPDLQAKVIDGVQSALPGQAGRDLVGTATKHAGALGVAGLVGLLYAGLGWVDNLRAAIRTVWHQNVKAGNIVKTKLADIVILLGLGLALGVSVAITGIGNAATSFVVDHLGVDGITGIGLLTKLVSILLAMVADVGIFLWLFLRLPRLRSPWRRIFKGAVFAAVGFELLKIVGSYYINRTTANASATYGTFGVVIGALVWINLVSRFTVFSAVWTVTAPYDDDVAPSGTVDRASARAADIPEEFAADPATDAAPAIRQQDGAPTPLTPALQGKPGVGYRAAERARQNDAEPAHQPAPPQVHVIDGYPAAPSASNGRSAGGRRNRKLVAGAIGAAVLGARSLRERIRR